MDTFFGTAEDLQDEEADEPAVWIGDEFGAYSDIESFEAAFMQALQGIGVEGFSIPDAQRTQLLADFTENPPGKGMTVKTVQMQDFLAEWRKGDMEF